jgi:pyruvate dehydrogenase E2 component (dihydrolipoamide acetyltransferase)
MAPGGTLVQAMPAVRSLAQKLGLDIDKVKGTGSAGMVTEQDVQQAFEAQQESGNEFLKARAGPWPRRWSSRTGLWCR